MKKEKRVRTDKSKLWTGSAIAALAAAISLFFVMLHTQKQVLSAYEKGVVCVAKCEIPKGKMITEDNRAQFLEMKELDSGFIPDTALCDWEQVQNRAALWDIEQGVLLTEGMFETLEEMTENLKEPVIAGFRAEDLYQAVGGVLRAGDRIHIYSVGETGARLVWENVVVQEVFDSAGNKIDSGDLQTAAQRINVYLDKSIVEQFYTELAGGSLRVVKVCGR